MFTRIDGQYKYTDGTQLQGYLPSVSYQKLVETFGPADLEGIDGKIQAHWALLFNSEVVATIYDWKCYGQPVESITKWNVGGHSGFAVELVKRELQKVSA